MWRASSYGLHPFWHSCHWWWQNLRTTLCQRQVPTYGCIQYENTGQFLQHLMDNITQHGAPTKLISNRSAAMFRRSSIPCSSGPGKANHTSSTRTLPNDATKTSRKWSTSFLTKLVPLTTAGCSVYTMCALSSTIVILTTLVAPPSCRHGAQPLMTLAPCMLWFNFYEPIYYKDKTAPFPSGSKEHWGYWVRVSNMWVALWHSRSWWMTLWRSSSVPISAQWLIQHLGTSMSTPCIPRSHRIFSPLWSKGYATLSLHCRTMGRTLLKSWKTMGRSRHNWGWATFCR